MAAKGLVYELKSPLQYVVVVSKINVLTDSQVKSLVENVDCLDLKYLKPSDDVKNKALFFYFDDETKAKETFKDLKVKVGGGGVRVTYR